MSDESGHNPFAAPEDRPEPPAGGAATTSGSGTVPQAPAYGAGPQAPPPGTWPASPYGAGPAASAGAPPVAPPYGTAPGYGAAPGAGSAPAHGGTPGYGMPPGSAAPAAPGYGAPTYPPAGYATYPGAYPTAFPAYAPAPQGTDGVAIGALVTAIAGTVLLLGLTSPVSLWLGIWGLIRTRRSGRRGKGLSIAAIVISAVVMAGWAVVLVVIGLLAANGGFDEGVSAAESDSYTLRSDLTPGTCLDVYPTTYQMNDAEVVDCSVSHGAEVVSLTTLPGPVVVDDDGDPSGTVFDDALRACEDEIVGLSPGADATGFADVFFSDPGQWPAKDAAYCVYASRDADLTGSVVAQDLSSSVSS